VVSRPDVAIGLSTTIVGDSNWGSNGTFLIGAVSWWRKGKRSVWCVIWNRQLISLTM
jgi:hypothetical protein